VGDALGRLVSLVMLPILSRAFVPADYGAIDLLAVAYGFLIICIPMNVTTGLQKFYYQNSGLDVRQLVTSCCFFLTLLTIVVAIGLAAGGNYLSELIVGGVDLRRAVQLLAFCLPIEIFFNCLLLLLRLQRKALYFSLINILRVILTPALTYVWVVLLSSGIDGVFISKLITLSILTLLTFIFERRNFSSVISFAPFKQMLLYAIPGHPSLIIKSLMNILPRYVLSVFASLSAVGLFGIAFRVTSVLNMGVEAFNRAWNPFAFANAGKPEERQLYELIFKTFAFGLIFFGLGLSLYAREVLMVLTPVEYHSAHLLVGGVTFFTGVRGLVLIYSTALYSVNQVKWTSYLTAFQLMVFLAAAAVLVPRYQTSGLIASLDLAAAIFLGCYLKVTEHFFPFFMPKLRLIFLLILACLAVLCFNFFELGLWVGIAGKLVFLLIYIWLGMLMLLTPSERASLRQYANTIYQHAPMVTSE